MSINRFFIIGLKKSRIEKRNLIIKFLSLFFILTFLFSFLFINEKFNQNNYSINGNLTNTNDIFKKDETLETAGGDIPLVQDPFTINFSNIRDYFNTKFKTNLPFRDNDSNIISTYFRDEFSKDVYSGDNLFLYKSLEKKYIDEFDTLKAYIDLSLTPLWFDGNSTHYGFVRTIDGTTGDIENDDRYLIDNLMPIFLMLENIDINNINTINYLGETPKSIVEKTFTLTNSSQFRDTANGGFFQFNSSSGKKDTKSNFYSILSNLLIHDFKNELAASVAKGAYDSAHDTIATVIDNLWDNTYKGFYNRSDSDWTSGFDDRRKCLDTNALGIIALVDFWIENESMDGNSLYLKNATSLYKKISTPVGASGGLWDPINEAYQFAKNEFWNNIDAINNRIDLEANSLMMQACLKLFEATGNITYYNRAIDLYNTFENKFYDSSVNAYRTSIGPINNNKNFSSNLMLTDAYLKAVELYYSTILDATFNTSSQVPDFIIDQDVLNLTCDYAFEKTISHSNPLIPFSGTNTTRYNNITGASITYIFYYPNNTIIDIIPDTIDDNTTTLLYPITESLPIDNGYSITIYANTTYFGTAVINKTFNIISGLESHPIQGLDDVDLYQGRTVNITLPVNNTRNDNITLEVSLEGFGIENATIMVNFTRYILTNVSFNLTIKDDAPPGKRNISFKFKNGSILYLEVVKEIEIVNALTYSNLIYHNKIVAGNYIQISMNLINFFPNATQSFNVSFSGNYINDVKLLAFLAENQMKTVFYNVFSVSIIPEDSIEIEMSISVGETIFYTEILTVEIIPKFEIISLEFSEDVIQGVNPHIIIIIQNNLDSSEEFTLIINDEKVSTDLDELSPGENRIEYEIERLYNPYEFGTKTVVIEIEDESEDSIVKKQFEYEVRISAINIIFFYLFPILIPIAVILFYKNKDIKNKLLRR